MLSRHLQSLRIPSIRPLRPPTSHLFRSQPFTQHNRQLLLTRDALRPQLPYLSQPSLQRRLSPLDQHILRLLSTESRQFVRNYAYLTVKWTAVLWSIIFLINVMLFGITQETEERSHPTPSEWSFWTRQAMRRARIEVEAWQLLGYINWATAGSLYLKAIARLEDPNIDGQGITIQQDDTTGGQIMIADIGSISFDVSQKSWQWRQGYYEALMGMVKVSENTEDMVRDVSRGLIFPKSTMLGPLNPDPRPVGMNMEAAPLEENCERPFDPPETYYMRILTATGFTTRQKLSAALAYAKWLNHSGLHDAAEAMLSWSVDIAKAPLQEGEILKPGTFIITTSKPSENLLRAVTDAGVHQARTGNTTAALPVLLSVLKARQEAPLSTLEPVPDPTPRRPATDIQAMTDTLRKMFTQRPDPQPQSSGDDAYMKMSQPTCEDSELMLYIGEIMYASSSMRSEGLSWTKRAVDIAEKEMELPTLENSEVQDPIAQLKKCRQCFKAGVENWSFMFDNLGNQSSKASGTVTQPRGWSSWSSSGQTDLASETEARESEAQRIEELRLKIRQTQDDFEIKIGGQPRTFTMFAG